MLAELDVVRLNESLGDKGLIAGVRGTVLEVFEGADPRYLVEFSDDDGQELALVVLAETQVERVWRADGGRPGSRRQAA